MIEFLGLKLSAPEYTEAWFGAEMSAALENRLHNLFYDEGRNLYLKVNKNLRFSNQSNIVEKSNKARHGVFFWRFPCAAKLSICRMKPLP